MTPFFQNVIKIITLMILMLCTPLDIFAISLTKTRELDFGKFVGGAGQSGAVTISPSGVRYAAGGVRPLGSIFSTARFTIYGSPLASYTLTIPASVTIISGEDYMEITSLVSSVPVTGVLPAGGTLSFTVGGTLTVNGTQKYGAYIGNFDISAAGN